MSLTVDRFVRENIDVLEIFSCAKADQSPDDVVSS